MINLRLHAGEPRGGNRRIVAVLLLAIGLASWLASKSEQPKARYIRSNDAERAVFVCV
jgi:hypothetical protein